MTVIEVAGLDGNSIDCEDDQVTEVKADVRQRESPFDTFLERPRLIDLDGLREHMNDSHAEEQTR